MSSTVGTTTNSTNSTTSSSSSSSTTSVSKNDFLKLLIAQMKNQDPLNPMDGTQYVAELAQFSSLEELQNLNDNMTTMISANYTLTQSINSNMAAALVGKEAKVTASTVSYSGQDSTEIGYTLPSNVSSITLNVTNSDGTVVKTIKSGLSKTSGSHKLSWDFTDNNGSKLPQGTYTYSISATNSSGTAVTASLWKQGTIDAVNYTSSGSTFTIDGTDYPVSDVLEILNSSTTSSSVTGLDSAIGGNNKWLK